MYNPDFWEVQVDPADLEQFPNEAGIWCESREDQESRYQWEDWVSGLVPQLLNVISEALTEKQREAVVLYFLHRKTQEEIAQILGVSRRVLSQHLFGISRNGKHVGGAVKKLRKRCMEQGIQILSFRNSASTTML
ncbi:MAG: sigma-70 family RNA polymerase sigma factor [Candidatus Latescibacteria bacterium]|nr:sigma-70 family RNA polymerase sigma factor [Candidatus Latescibacterota bacterium]